jgi:hypothetical protein
MSHCLAKLKTLNDEQLDEQPSNPVYRAIEEHLDSIGNLFSWNVRKPQSDSPEAILRQKLGGGR